MVKLTRIKTRFFYGSQQAHADSTDSRRRDNDTAHASPFAEDACNNKSHRKQYYSASARVARGGLTNWPSKQLNRRTELTTAKERLSYRWHRGKTQKRQENVEFHSGCLPVCLTTKTRSFTQKKVVITFFWIGRGGRGEKRQNRGFGCCCFGVPGQWRHIHL